MEERQVQVQIVVLFALLQSGRKENFIQFWRSCSSILYCMPGGWEVEVAIFIDFHHTVFASLKNYKFVGKN